MDENERLRISREPLDEKVKIYMDTRPYITSLTYTKKDGGGIEAEENYEPRREML